MGVINNGFYYPDETEIHVGWEGEYNASKAYNDTYEPITISYPKDSGVWYTNIEDVLSMAIWDGCDEIRCPLLTKEQIEKEGWELKRSSDQGLRQIFEKGDYLLDWNQFTTFMRIDPKPRNILSGFTGNIPTINHLRTIMKLLKIK